MQPRRRQREQALSPLIERISQRFLDGAYRRIDMLYQYFESAFAQSPVVATLLPVTSPGAGAATLPDETVPAGVLVDPRPADVLEWVLPEWVRRAWMNAFLNSLGSESAARQTAMTRAQDNAESIIDELGVQYRRLRQESITTEMLELSGGHTG